MKKYSIAILFVVMLAGGLAIGYVYNDRPEAVVGPAIRKLGASRSFMAAVTVGTFAPEAVVRAAGADPNLVLLPVVFVGEAGVNLPEDKPMSGTATFELVGDKTKPDVSFDVVSADDGTSYVKFENIPTEKTSAKIVDELNGQWYSMRSRGLAALLAKDGDARAVDEDPSGKPAADAWRRIRSAIANGDLFSAPVALGAEVLGTVTTRRYSLPFRHDALVQLAADIKTIVRGRELTGIERDGVAKDMSGQDVSLEVWIDRRAGTLVQMNLDVKSNDGQPAAATGKPSHLSVLARFTSWDAPVEVKAPADSRPFSEFIQGLKKR